MANYLDSSQLLTNRLLYSAFIYIPSSVFMSYMSKTKLIVVSQANYEALRKWGEFGDSYNSIITKILARVDSMPNPTTTKEEASLTNE